ncbi:MAG TPA: AsmA-like C-terminal domain-containing protein, partial [Gammaproteobacteria bacterium]|nr:AsmA-like C-terminal domain-containing protein [Gammaproteobacteria bacterium]
SLELRGLRLPLVRGPDGRLSAGGFRVDPERNRVFPVLARFKRFRITHGRLLWEDHRDGQTARLTLRDWRVDIERGARNHLVDLTGRAAGGEVAVRGSIDRFAGGPGRWRLNVQARAAGVDPGPFRAYLGGRAPQALPGPVSLWAEMTGGLEQDSRIRGHFHVAPGTLRWPQRLRRPLEGVAADGAFRYRGTPGDHRLRLEETRVAAGSLAVTGSAGLEWGQGKGLPRVETRMQLEPAPVNGLRPLYAVAALPAPVADWLGRALAGGRIRQARAEVSGPVADFPYADGGGTFRVRARVAGLDLDYHPGWPPLTGLSGTLAVDRRRLTLHGEDGRILRARIRDIEASVHDLAGQPPHLRLRGDVDLQLVDGVHFLERSPLQPAGFLEPADLVGPAGLHLGLDLPLADGGEPDVYGRLRLKGAAFRPRVGMPSLVAVTGTVDFQGGRIRARGLHGRLLGQPVSLDLERDPDGPLRAKMGGAFPAAVIRTALARHGLDNPLNRRLTGNLGVGLGVVWGREERHAELRADLEGAALVLPEPAFNGIGDPGELTLRWEQDPRRHLSATLTTPDSQWQGLARPADGGWGYGLAVGLDRRSPPPETGVLRVAGNTEELPLGQWADLVREVAPERPGALGGGGLPRLQAELQARRVTWRDWDLGGGRVILSGRRKAGAYVLTTDLYGERAAGRLDWTRHPDQRNDLRIRLERLILPAVSRWQRPEGVNGLGGGGSGLALNLRVEAERIDVGDKTLTGSALKARLDPDRWLLQGLHTAMGKTELRLQGAWRRETGRTQLRVDLDTRDFGGWLRAIEVYPSMDRGRGTIRGNVWWPGVPSAFAPGRLSGDLNLRMREGEIEELYFLSKALATLNVLDWPQQVARGFRDMATGGLVYREIKGGVHIADGVAYTRDWALESAPLRLTGTGSVDLGDRTYDLLLRIQPLQTIDRIISAVPVLGYLLTGDAKTVMALDYSIQGPWSDPEVTALTGEAEENPVETLIRRLKEMQWKDVLPWR